MIRGWEINLFDRKVSNCRQRQEQAWEPGQALSVRVVVSVGVAERPSKYWHQQKPRLGSKKEPGIHQVQRDLVQFFTPRGSSTFTAATWKHFLFLRLYAVRWLFFLVDLPVTPKFGSCSLPLPACQCHPCSQPSSDIFPKHSLCIFKA